MFSTFQPQPQKIDENVYVHISLLKVHIYKIKFSKVIGQLLAITVSQLNFVMALPILQTISDA